MVTPVSSMTGSWGTCSGILRTFQPARCAACRASRAVMVCPTDWPRRCQCIAAGVGEGDLTVGDIEFVCHGSCSFPRSGVRFAPFSAGVWGTGGVAVSTPKRPAEKQEADFRPGEPGAQRPGRAAIGPINAAGAARAQRQPSVSAAKRRTGEPAGRGLTATGSLTVILGPR